MKTSESSNPQPPSRLGQPEELKRAIEHLRTGDRRLRRIIDKHGPIEFRPSGDVFESLVESILSQQLASAAASSIIARFRSIYSPSGITPQRVRKTPARKLRMAGVSPQKVSYLRDLSARVSEGAINLEALREKSDRDVMAILDQVRGIGPWTVQMLLIFTLGRPDVLPVGDLGIRKAIQRIYSLRALPSAKTSERIAEPWHPYCSVASLFLWREKDGM